MDARLGIILMLVGASLYLLPVNILGLEFFPIGTGGLFIGSGLFVATMTTQQFIGAVTTILGLVIYLRGRKTQ